MRSIAVASAAVLLAACASNWTRPGITQQQYAADRYACTQQSRTGFAGGGTGYYGLGAIIGSAIVAQSGAQYLMDLCMEARGYTKVMDSQLVAQQQTAAAAQGVPAGGMPGMGQAAPTPVFSPVSSAPPVPESALPGAVPPGAVSGEAPRTAAAVAQLAAAPYQPPGAIPIGGESRYQLSAEALVKATGCVPPYAVMVAKGGGVEQFKVGCPGGKVLSVSCEASPYGQSPCQTTR